MHHERLRLARERRGWSVEELARRSGLRVRTVEMVERGAFAELPAGLYCRSTIRSYASAVGLDPNELLEALGPMLPVPEDALDGLARLRGHARKPDVRSHESIVAASVSPAPLAAPAPVHPPLERPTATIVDFSERLALRVTADAGAGAVEEDAVLMIPEMQASDLDGAAAAAPLRSDAVAMDDLSLMPFDASEVEPAAAVGIEPVTDQVPLPDARPSRERWRSVAASSIDGALLAAMGGVLVWLTAMVCGTSVAVALRVAGPALALVFALIVTLYFVIFGGIGNATLGVYVMRLDASPRTGFGHIDDSLMAD